MSERGSQKARLPDPPRDEEAEAAVLGAMMLSLDVIGDVVEKIQPDDFYTDMHRQVFKVIVDLFGEGKPIDPVSVRGEMASRGLNVNPLELHEMVSVVGAPQSGLHYADIVAEVATRRRLFDAGHDIIRIAEVGEGEVVAQAEDAVYRVSNLHPGRNAVLLEAVVYDVLAGLTRPNVSALRLGLRDLDRKLTGSGLRPGTLTIVAARPGVGKSAFVANVCRNVARDGHAVVLFSLEMSKDELGERFLHAEARGRDIDAMAEVAPDLAGLPLWIVDAPGLTLSDIRARTRRLRATADLRLAVVDYLQLMGTTDTSSSRNRNREQEVAEISRGLKGLSKELGIPIIAVSQLNRNVEHRKGSRPRLDDLRESGSLEQDSDVVLLIYRDEAGDEQSRGKAEVIIAKNRTGPTDVVYLTFLAKETRFVDYAEGH